MAGLPGSSVDLSYLEIGNSGEKDFTNSEATMMNMVTLRMVATLQLLKWDEECITEHWDVSQCFKHSDLKEQIFVNQPPGHEDPDHPASEWVWLLRKSLYGLKQAGHDWQALLDEICLSIGMKRCVYDPSTYVLWEGSKFVIMPVWVDDLFPTSNSRKLMDKVWGALSKRLTMKDLGPMKLALKMNIQVDKDFGLLKWSHAPYIIQMINDFDMSGCKPCDTPMDPNDQLIPEDGDISEEEKGQVKKIPFFELHGRLLWIHRCARPDISVALNIISKNLKYPSLKLWKKMKRLLRYLAKDPHKGIVVHIEPGTTLDDFKGDLLKGWVDADWASCKATRHSRSGGIIKFLGGVIDWFAKMQSTIATSTTESENNGLLAIGKVLIWLRHLVHELGLSPEKETVVSIATTVRDCSDHPYVGDPALRCGLKPVRVMCDNSGAVQLARSGTLSSRTRHYDIHKFKVHEWQKLGFLNVSWISTTDEEADMMTKPLPRIPLEKFVSRTMGSPQQQNHFVKIGGRDEKKDKPVKPEPSVANPVKHYPIKRVTWGKVSIRTFSTRPREEKLAKANLKHLVSTQQQSKEYSSNVASDGPPKDSRRPPKSGKEQKHPLPPKSSKSSKPTGIPDELII